MTTTPNYAHHTFKPWRVDGDKRIVASERDWEEAEPWNEQGVPGGGRPRVLVDVDAFEDRHIPDSILCDVSTVRRRDRIYRRRIFTSIDATPNLDWLVWTKYPQNIARMLPPYFPGGYIAEAGSMNQEGPRPNLWLGTVITDQATADERIPHLLDVPAAVRFVVCELTGLVRLDAIKGRHQDGSPFTVERSPLCSPPHTFDARFRGIDWVIARGGDAPIHPDWLRSLRDQCEAAGVPFWFEGWGSWVPSGAMGEHCFNPGESVHKLVAMKRVGAAHSGRVLDGRTHGGVPEVRA